MHLTSFIRSTLSFRTILLAAAHAQISPQGTCNSRPQFPSSDLSSSEESCDDIKMANADENWKSATSVYDFHAKDIDGNDVSLEKYRGQVLIIVNVACKCGFTNTHYKQLAELHEKYKPKGLNILGFPCNQFMNQEPSSEAEIKAFVKDFNVQFDMFSKVEVNGSGAHPLWKYLKHKQGGTLVDAIKWNFTKFLVDRNGQPVARHAGNTNPIEMEAEIVKLL